MAATFPASSSVLEGEDAVVKSLVEATSAAVVLEDVNHDRAEPVHKLYAGGEVVMVLSIVDCCGAQRKSTAIKTSRSQSRRAP